MGTGKFNGAGKMTLPALKLPRVSGFLGMDPRANKAI
jgi:hypothetical protein